MEPGRFAISDSRGGRAQGASGQGKRKGREGKPTAARLRGDRARQIPWRSRRPERRRLRG